MVQPRDMASLGSPLRDESASREIDAIIESLSGWKGKTLTRLRGWVKEADPTAIEEIKWRKPSRPQGVPVWSHDGIICVGEALKNAVRLTFPNGALIQDPHHLFNARLDSKTVRAIDVHEGEASEQAAFTRLIQAAAKLNQSKLSHE